MTSPYPKKNKMIRTVSNAIITGFILAGLFAPYTVDAKTSVLDRALATLVPEQSLSVPAKGDIEVGFSPNEGAEELVLKIISTAQFEIKILAYSFTSASVVEALIRARKQRGVNVSLVADKSNLSERGKGRAALATLVNAGCDVRVISTYPIHHDKAIIADRKNIEIGSFNYSDAAAHKNSENVFVNWNNPDLASVYLDHFERNQRQATIFNPY